MTKPKLTLVDRLTPNVALIFYCVRCGIILQYKRPPTFLELHRLQILFRCPYCWSLKRHWTWMILPLLPRNHHRARAVWRNAFYWWRYTLGKIGFWTARSIGDLLNHHKLVASNPLKRLAKILFHTKWSLRTLHSNLPLRSDLLIPSNSPLIKLKKIAVLGKSLHCWGLSLTTSTLRSLNRRFYLLEWLAFSINQLLLLGS